MILVIRISGMVEIPNTVQETLDRMRLRRKYCAILLNESKETDKLLDSVRNFVAFGTINEETLTKLLTARGVSKDKKKLDVKHVVEQLAKKRDLSDIGVKPFFRLHSPRGGIDTKRHFGVAKGVLGNNKEKINELVGRML